MLAARALGIGCVPTTLHPIVMPRFRALFGVPEDVGFHLCVPLGYLLLNIVFLTFCPPLFFIIFRGFW